MLRLRLAFPWISRRLARKRQGATARLVGAVERESYGGDRARDLVQAWVGIAKYGESGHGEAAPPGGVTGCTRATRPDT